MPLTPPEQHANLQEPPSIWRDVSTPATHLALNLTPRSSSAFFQAFPDLRPAQEVGRELGVGGRVLISPSLQGLREGG